jgi:hypothetical protein
MKESQVTGLLKLRFLVGYLGERAQFNWWATSFFEPASKNFLAPTFPKTSRLAQYHAVSEAARLLHDEHIGVGNAFHLFRLPEEVEREMHGLVEQASTDSDLFAPLLGKESALEALKAFADGGKGTAEGPVHVARYGEAVKPASLRETAHLYLHAFEEGIRTYPYFLV